MSWQHHPGDGAYGPNDGAYGSNAENGAAAGYPAGGSHPDGGEDRNQPNVYHPYAVAEPDYGGYADPAAAHGWQNAYDETRELPVTHGADGGAIDTGVVGEARASRRRARTSSRSPLPRRAALAVGALGAVGVVVALAGGFGSGSSGAPADAGQSARPKAAPSASPTEATGIASSSAAGPSRTAGSVAAATEASATPGASRGAAPVSATSEAPTSAAPTAGGSSATPTDPASATTPGNSGGKPGRGRGATKGPK
ncbi:hypothetical protein SY2F82_25040 [Streptomyces sp. Y2F8-2]|uniref:hypothetical protein n=1 Tax=Streptomyces sp. Y2F8-2 TaxID=2759675 RepID=UPI0019053612|nr:hypothetical protein [Streptomyces sp. Y2F8-2]GHK00707.1 hypothetical protein SY2F82_25040 [Streptomyces sp. Y2F8-2]